MKKKNMIMLNTLRNVKKYPGRFIAIMAIIAISCTFYSGVKSASPDMKNSAWDYYDEYALADIQLKSTLGFDDTDIDSLLGGDNFGAGYAGYSGDFLTDGTGGSAAVKVMSYSDEQPLNKLMLTEGRTPSAPDECLADAESGQKITFEIGQRIVLENDSDEDISESLEYTEFTVVGLVKSPLYVTFDRGATQIGTGSLSAFIYIPEESFAYGAYTDIYLSVPEAHADGIAPFSGEYSDIVEKAELFLGDVSLSYLESRGNSIRAEAEEEIADARQKLADGEKKYNDGYKEYSDGLKEYNDGYKEFTEQRKEFEDAAEEYENGVKEIAEGEERLTRLSGTCDQIDGFLEDYAQVYMKILPDALLDVFKEIQQIYDENDVDASISDLLAVYIISNPVKDPQSKTAAGAAIQGVNEQVRAASAAALSEISVQKAALDAAGKTIEENRALIDEAEQEIKDAKKELDSAKRELDDAQAEINDAKAEIADAEAEIEETVSDGEWYIWNRDEFNPGCMSYGEDADRVDSIAAVFPIFFILIAALVCCTTMSRMVEEQRTETGTLKALGYGSFTIIMQYVLYAAIASVIGSLLGTALGFALLPEILFRCYETMYRYPSFSSPFIPSFAAGCMAVSLICTTGSAAAASVSELSDVPAALIRPKPPKNGKRILLEKIGFIWRRMKFSYKVTFRNLLRYKSRFLMTIVGIGGCTALLLTAFGLKESIACIADKQYDEIFLYDAMAVLGDKADEEDRNALDEVIDGSDEIISHMGVIQESRDVFSESADRECYIFAPSDAEGLNDYIVLRRRSDGSPIALSDGGVVINEKLSNMLGAGKGDTINIEGAESGIVITDIAENYTFHYVYMTQNTYRSLFGEKEDNIILINTGDTPEKSVRNEVSSRLIACGGVISASFTFDGTDNFRKLVSSLDLIVAVLIVFAGALSLLILFNLANININERIREIATIKVLGFFDGEVSAYIYRENIVSSFIGIACGLVLGIFLEGFVVKTAEVDEVMFSPDIPWFCFILAAAVMMIFAAAVNVLLHFKLKKIDMASSMKAIE